jgi:hypothetical protein
MQCYYQFQKRLSGEKFSSLSCLHAVRLEIPVLVEADCAFVTLERLAVCVDDKVLGETAPAGQHLAAYWALGRSPGRPAATYK